MIKRISVHDLQPGMRTAKLEETVWLQEPGLYDGAPSVLSIQDIEEIRANGYSTVCIVVGKSAAASVPVEESMQVLAQAREVYLDALKVASRVVMEVAQGRVVDVSGSRQVVKSLLAAVERDADAVTCVTRLTPVDTYLCSHMVNVTGVSLAFGRFLGLRDAELIPLGLAAFLHDIGMTKLPLGILCGKGLSSLDELEIQKHPRFSAGLLRTAGGLSKNIRRAAMEHHENHDGSGYPEQLAGKSISSWARILHLADVYDGLTRTNCRGQAKVPNEALSRMYSMGGVEFDQEDVERFVKCMGVYPAGSLVRINTGDVGVVIKNNPASPTLPLLRLLRDEHGEPLRPRLRDLGAKTSMDDGVRIVEVVGNSLQPGEVSAQMFGAN